MCHNATTDRQTVNLSPPDLPLETDRLVLRDYIAEDWQICHRYARSETFYRFLPIDPPTVESVKSFVQRAIEQQRQQPRTIYTLVAVLKESGASIGDARISISDGANRAGDLGYGFDPAYQARGFATEAVGRLVALGFEHFGLHRIFATCDPENAGSARVLEKLGMRREGHLRKHTLIRGEWRDSFVYAILEDEFATNRTTGCRT